MKRCLNLLSGQHGEYRDVKLARFLELWQIIKHRVMTVNPKKVTSQRNMNEAAILKDAGSSILIAHFEEQLNDILYAENAFISIYQNMCSLASNDELIAVLDKYMELSQRNIMRIKEIFARLKRKPSTGKSQGIESLIKEANNLLKVCQTGPSGDAVIISTIQILQHHEITSFSALLGFSRVIGLSETEQSIRQTLTEQKQANQSLINMAVLFGMNMERLFVKVHKRDIEKNID